MNSNLEEDYAWRFSLREGEIERVYENKFIDMVRMQLERLLDLARLTYKGKVVRVDGFQMVNNPDNVYRIFADSKSIENSDVVSGLRVTKGGD